MATLKGIITVLATPFDKRGAIAYDVLGEHVEFLLSSGVKSLVEGGSTGEYYALDLVERKKTLAYVARRVDGRAQLIAGTNSARPSETLELNAYAQDLGYEAVMLAAPFYSLPTTADLVTHFRAVAAATSLGIILYNFPARTGVDMNPEFLAGVRDVENIIAIKESSGSFARTLEHFLRFPSLKRVCGSDDQAVDAFLWGAESWIAGASNLLPAEHVALYRACVERKDYVLGQKMMAALLPLFYLLEQGGKYIQYVKYGTALAGHPVGGPRPPLNELTEGEKAQFRTFYDAVKQVNIPSMLGQ